jgi:hypothetical protein
LGAVLPWLGAEDAAKYAGVAARALTDALAKAPAPNALGFLAQGLGAVSARLSPEDAAKYTAAAARALTDAIAKTSDPKILRDLAQGLRAVSEERLDPNEVGSRAVLLARGIGESMSPATRLPGLATLTQATQPLPSRVSTQQLVDLLKMPLCIGDARTVFLEMLGQRYHRTFADQWEFVEYAEKQLPGIDLKSPPKRPAK